MNDFEDAIEPKWLGGSDSLERTILLKFSTLTKKSRCRRTSKRSEIKMLDRARVFKSFQRSRSFQSDYPCSSKVQGSVVRGEERWSREVRCKVCYERAMRATRENLQDRGHHNEARALLGAFSRHSRLKRKREKARIWLILARASRKFRF